MGHEKENIVQYGQYSNTKQNTSQELLVAQPTKTWKGAIWDTWDLPKDQRWLLFKLDAFVLTFASVNTLSLMNVIITLSDMMCTRSDTFSRTWIWTILTMPSSAVWRRNWKCMVISLWPAHRYTPLAMSSGRYHPTCCLHECHLDGSYQLYVLTPSSGVCTRAKPLTPDPQLEIGWGISTICTSTVKSYKALYALRFLVGLFEYVPANFFGV